MRCLFSHIRVSRSASVAARNGETTVSGPKWHTTARSIVTQCPSAVQSSHFQVTTFLYLYTSTSAVSTKGSHCFPTSTLAHIEQSTSTPVNIQCRSNSKVQSRVHLYNQLSIIGEHFGSISVGKEYGQPRCTPSGQFIPSCEAIRLLHTLFYTETLHIYRNYSTIATFVNSKPHRAIIQNSSHVHRSHSRLRLGHPSLSLRSSFPLHAP